MDDLRDKTAVVTGGTRGIGHAVAGALIEDGATVVFSARSAVAVQRLFRIKDAVAFAVTWAARPPSPSG